MRKLKGFTLLELIIVMAIFSIIMYSAVQLLDPVSKFFVRSSNFENTTACIDNMRRCIEGNLKYADRVRVYFHQTPYTYASDFKSVTPTAQLEKNVGDFYDTFFANRQFLDVEGNIYVLVFDNTLIEDDTALKTHTKLSEYTSKQINQGKLVLFTYPYDARTDTASTVVAKGTYDLWSVNQKLYGNFDYSFSMSELKDAAIQQAIDNPFVTTASTSSVATTTATTATDINGTIVTAAPFVQEEYARFNPQDFTIRIDCREIRRSPNGLIRKDTGTSSVASFSMKNVLNAADGFRTAAVDYVPTLSAGVDVNASEGFSYTIARKPARFKDIDPAEVGTDSNFFYFIFTVPDDVHDIPDLEASFDKDHDNRLVNQKAVTTTN